jgi:hypothetical protein
VASTDHIDVDGIAVRQGKTKTALWIPFTPRLREYLPQLPFRNLTIVAGPEGAQVNYHSTAAPIRVLRANRRSAVRDPRLAIYSRIAACGGRRL